MLLKSLSKGTQIDEIPLRMLANIGDAVCALYERERAIISCASAKQMHQRVKDRVNARAQAALLDQLSEMLNERELNLVRRAKNLKSEHRGKSDQVLYRKATAFEALLGYLYLTDLSRLSQLLQSLDGENSPQTVQSES